MLTIEERLNHDNLTRKEILSHYGYDPETTDDTPFGFWFKEEVFERLKKVESFLNDFEANRKRPARICLDYDPNYPRAIFSVQFLSLDQG